MNQDIREVLFGDMPLKDRCKGSGSPWIYFAEAREHIDNGDNLKAMDALKQVLSIHGLESRHYIQAWYHLRELGVMPDKNIAKKVFGVIFEVSLDKGLDILAVYENHSARYFNYSGKAVIWDRPDDSLDGVIDQIIKLSQKVVNKIGPWEKERPGPPQKGDIRLNFLTPLGLHFGQGPFGILAKDPMGGPIINVGTYLMQKLIQLGQK